MGFWSHDCKCCGKSVRSYYARTPKTEWMTKVVIEAADETRLVGQYDGYGRIGHTHVPEGATWYHKACWTLMGKPGYQGPSRSSKDQGYFTDTEFEEPTEARFVEVIKGMTY